MAGHKSFFLKAFLLFMVASLYGSPLFAMEGKLKMAVLDFKTVGDSAELGEGAAEILRTTLVETGKYTVVERSMLKEALKEQKLGLSGTIDQNTAVGIGKVLGAQIVAVGSVVKLGESYTLNIRFVDVETGEVISGKKLTAKNREAIPDLCGQMVKMLTKRNVPPVEEEQTLPQPIIKLSKTQTAEIKKPSTAGNWALGGIYPGVSLKYVTGSTSAWELRVQSGSGIFAIGPRYYQYFTRDANPRLFFGIEADYITFKGKESKGAGFAGGAFVGGEIFLTKQIGLLMDFGPMYINLKENEYSQSDSGMDYMVNMGIYWHFR